MPSPPPLNPKRNAWTVCEGVSPQKRVHRRSCKTIMALESITAILFAPAGREHLRTTCDRCTKGRNTSISYEVGLLRTFFILWFTRECKYSQSCALHFPAARLIRIFPDYFHERSVSPMGFFDSFRLDTWTRRSDWILCETCRKLRRTFIIVLQLVIGRTNCLSKSYFCDIYIFLLLRSSNSERD